MTHRSILLLGLTALLWPRAASAQVSTVPTTLLEKPPIGTDAFKRFLPRIVVHNETKKKETAARTPAIGSSNTNGKDDDEGDDSVQRFPTDLPGVGVDDDEARGLCLSSARQSNGK